MTLPESANCTPKDIKPEEKLPRTDEAYIYNPVDGKKLLTPMEALNTINVLSGILLADGSIRRH